METNNLGLSMADAQKYFHEMHESPIVDWKDRRLAKITRLRLLGGDYYSYWDVHYCHGVLKDGTKVRVDLPFSQLHKGNIGVQIVKFAKADNVYAKGLGVFDAISCLD